MYTSDINHIDWERTATLVLGIITIVSLPMSIIFYWKQRKIKRLICLCSSSPLVSRKDGAEVEVEIKYPKYGEPVPRVTLETWIIYNNGTELIDKSDLAGDRSISIVPDDGVVILNCEVISQTSEACKVTTKRLREKNLCELKFDHLNSNEGAVISIHHTGTLKNTCKVKGKIKGGSLSSRIPLSSQYGHFFYSLPFLFFAMIIAIFDLLEPFGVWYSFGLGIGMHQTFYLIYRLRTDTSDNFAMEELQAKYRI